MLSWHSIKVHKKASMNAQSKLIIVQSGKGLKRYAYLTELLGEVLD